MADLFGIFDRLSLAVRESGALALASQGKVANEGKELDVVVENESEHLRLMRTAKTVIDEQVQEIMLSAAFECLGEDVVIDAEEKTHSLARFPTSDGARSLVIDPIDGTLEYLEGQDTYSVCVALIDRGTIACALVYFPARDRAYGVAPDGYSYEYPSFATAGLSAAVRLRLPQTAARIVYKTRRTPPEFERRFTDAGFEVRGWDNNVEGLLAVVSGEASGYIAGAPQIRDILIGPAIGAAERGFMCDWHGGKITWPQKGRLPEGFFGNASYEREFNTILSR